MGTNLILEKINTNRKKNSVYLSFIVCEGFYHISMDAILYLVQFLASFKIVFAQSPSKITPEKCTTYLMKHLSPRSADLYYITCCSILYYNLQFRQRHINEKWKHREIRQQDQSYTAETEAELKWDYEIWTPA